MALRTSIMSLVKEPLSRVGISTEPEAILSYSDASRRKCVFNAQRTPNGMLLGFNEKSSNEIVPLDACPVLVPAINEQLDAIRDLVNSVPTTKNPLRVSVLKQAEDDMSDIVSEFLKGCKQVADLYCGIGTFALKLAENSAVYAVEESGDALNSLDQAWRDTGGKLKQVKTEKRNLERRPVTFGELKKMDGLVYQMPLNNHSVYFIMYSQF